MGLFYIISKFLFIYKAKTPHFLYAKFNTYRKWKWLLKLAVSLNKRYTPCEVYRQEYKHLKEFVVIGLKWNGKQVKRRTSGFAKYHLKKKSGLKCIYCDRILTDENATSDHIIPISKRGNNSQVNLVISCRDCNSDRGNLEFYNYLRKRNTKLTYKEYLFV